MELHFKYLSCMDVSDGTSLYVEEHVYYIDRCKEELEARQGLSGVQTSYLFS